MAVRRSVVGVLYTRRCVSRSCVGVELVCVDGHDRALAAGCCPTEHHFTAADRCDGLIVYSTD